MSYPTAPRTIPHSEIETIICKDGTRVNLSPCTSFGNSSPSQSFPHSSSLTIPQRRHRGDSLVSTSSSGSSTQEIRDIFSILTTADSSLTNADTSPSLLQASCYTHDGQTLVNESPVDLIDHVTGAELDDSFFDQDRMVAEATGPDAGDFFFIDDVIDYGALYDTSVTQTGATGGLGPASSSDSTPMSPLPHALPQQDSLFGSLVVSHPPLVALDTATANRNDVATVTSNITPAFDNHVAEQPASRPKKANGQPKQKPGRKPGMHLQDAAKTAYQRLMGACDYCKSGKRSCDAGTPCKHCQRQEISCIRRGLQTHVNNMLAPQMRWHPFARTPSSFFASGYHVINGSFVISFGFAFGPPLRARVQAIAPVQIRDLEHRHVYYLIQNVLRAEPCCSDDVMLPVQFECPDELPQLIEGHLDNLVSNHLAEFKAFQSECRIFSSIVKLYGHYTQENRQYAALLHTSLKLLILVHSGDTFVNSQDIQILQVLNRLVPMYDGTQNVVACLLRAQSGRYIPGLARSLLKTVLDKLIEYCGQKRSDQHPIILAVFVLVLMSLESIMHHGARLGFHHYLNDAHATIEESRTLSLANGEKSASELLKFYKDGFENCHRAMIQITENQYAPRTVPEQFLADVCQAIQSAEPYLRGRAAIHVESLQDVNQLFDRLLAKLFLRL